MATVTIELPPQYEQRPFNERRWSELLADGELARIEGRIETDRYGRVVVHPLPAPPHGILQAEIAHELRTRKPHGRVLTECPVSTADGVKGVDVAWASEETMRELGGRGCFPQAPEICVEVLSPINTDAEIREKTALYFDAGATEVWICSLSGAMTFLRAVDAPMAASQVFPDFPAQVLPA